MLIGVQYIYCHCYITQTLHQVYIKLCIMQFVHSDAISALKKKRKKESVLGSKCSVFNHQHRSLYCSSLSREAGTEMEKGVTEFPWLHLFCLLYRRASGNCCIHQLQQTDSGSHWSHERSVRAIISRTLVSLSQ